MRYTPRPFYGHVYISPHPTPPTLLKDINLITNVYALSYVLSSGSLQTCAVMEWFFFFSFLYVFFSVCVCVCVCVDDVIFL